MKTFMICMTLVICSIIWAGTCYGSEEIITQATVQEVGVQTKAVMNEATKTLEFTFDKIEGYFGKVQEIVEKYGGDVVDLGMNVLRIDAMAEILPGIIFLIFLIFSVKIFMKNWRNANFDDENPEMYLILISGVFSIPLMLLVCLKLLNIWAWVGIFYPELYAVHKFLL